MTTSATAQMTNNNSRVNIDALDAIVKGHGEELGAIRTQISGLGNRMESAIQAISSKIDNQQQAAWNQQQAVLAGNKTNWLAVMGAVGTAGGVFVSVFVVIGSMALNPIKDGMSRHEVMIEKEMDDIAKKVSSDIYTAGLAAQQVRNLAMEKETAKVNDDLTAARLVLANQVGADTERHEQYLRDQTQMYAQFASLNADMVKRSEHEEHWKQQAEAVADANMRISAISARFNSALDSFNIGDAVKELQSRMNSWASPPTIAPMIAPTPPRAQ